MAPRPFRLGRARTGIGCFATRLIKKRKRIAEYKGPLLDNDAALKAEARGNRYLYEVSDNWTIDGKSRKNVARYFNHSCNPNADTTIKKKRVFIFTLRDIQPGEEIVYNYGNSYLKYVIGGVSKCQCSRCRKRRAKNARLQREKRERHKLREVTARKKTRGAKAKKKARKRA